MDAGVCFPRSRWQDESDAFPDLSYEGWLHLQFLSQGHVEVPCEASREASKVLVDGIDRLTSSLEKALAGVEGSKNEASEGHTKH